MRIGIDEVGRGPIAGPVTVGGVLLKKRLPKKVLDTYRDSKKLSSSQRDEWFLYIKELTEKGVLTYHVASVSARTIDTIGISASLQRAMKTVLKKLRVSEEDTILLDGSLYAPKGFKKQKTIIKGDEKEPLIALASIAAKVTRDRYMIRQERKFPGYEFAQHKGYGTRKHYTCIEKQGVCSLHRKSFLTRTSF